MVGSNKLAKKPRRCLRSDLHSEPPTSCSRKKPFMHITDMALMFQKQSSKTSVSVCCSISDILTNDSNCFAHFSNSITRIAKGDPFPCISFQNSDGAILFFLRKGWGPNLIIIKTVRIPGNSESLPSRTPASVTVSEFTLKFELPVCKVACVQVTTAVPGPGRAAYLNS